MSLTSAPTKHMYQVSRSRFSLCLFQPGLWLGWNRLRACGGLQHFASCLPFTRTKRIKNETSAVGLPPPQQTTAEHIHPSLLVLQYITGLFLLTTTMFADLEIPMAYSALGFASMSLLWKSPFGIDWIPLVGPAWEQIFTAHSAADNTARIPQYPRRAEGDDFWHIVYLMMYGVLGTTAQYCGIMISRRSISRTTLVLYSRIYACFHVVIGIHHLIWSQNMAHGKLQLWQFNLPGTYLGTSLTAVGMIYQAYKIGRGDIQSADVKDICYRKSVLDTATITTFISFVAFLVCNMLGIETSFNVDRLLWGMTMYTVPLVVLAGFLLQPKYN